MSDVALHRLGGEGPDLLLIHGFGADRLSWLAVAPQLFDLATVWAVEYAGHGAAGDDPGAGDPLTVASAIGTAIDGKLTRPHIVGHSLGGTLALHLAAMMPDDLSGLLLLAPASLAGGIDTGFVRAIPELDDPGAALDLLRRLVSRKVLSRRTGERRFARLHRPLKAPSRHPFPPNCRLKFFGVRKTQSPRRLRKPHRCCVLSTGWATCHTSRPPAKWFRPSGAPSHKT